MSGRQRLLGFYCIAVLALQFAAEWMGAISGNNLPLFHLYCLIEFGLFFYLFLPVLRYWLPPLMVRLVPLPWIATAILQATFGDGLYAYPTATRTFTAVACMLFALAYFIMSLNELNETHLLRSFLFWISSAALLYFGTTLTLILFSERVVMGSDRLFALAWSMHSILNILLYLIFSISLICPDQTRKS